MALVTTPENSRTGLELQAPVFLEELSHADAARWDDLIAGYADRQVFHCQAWLDYLAASRGAQIRKWRICRSSETVGHFCAGVISKGPFRILGSPLKGWCTNSMGPLLASAVDPREFLLAIDTLAKAENIAIVEMEHEGLDPKAMAAAGYVANTLWTYRVPLDTDEQSMLRRMSKGRRYGIKKAVQSGLFVEECTDPAIADEYYEQFSGVMHRKGLAPSYGPEVPRLLMQTLMPRGVILALRVRDANNRVLATGLFPFDNGVLYFWGGASIADRELCPNDLLHWGAMRLGARLGLHCYDLSGWGRFKKEFGGALITVQRWHKYYWRTAEWARRAYELYFKQRMRISGLRHQYITR